MALLSGRWRKRVFAAGALLIVVAAAWAAFRFVFVPHWRPPLQEGERYGVDVSSHQGRIDWTAVADDEIEFAYIKATEGGDFVDVYFEENWRAADAAGLDRGAYHFFTLCTPGLTQAENFLRVATPEPAALAPAVDLELAGNCGDRPDAASVEAEVADFLDAVEDAWGQPVVLYVGDDWEARYPVRERLDRPLWHLRFLRRPNVDGWLIWQIHGFARVEGISGGVDLNIMRP